MKMLNKTFECKLCMCSIQVEYASDHGGFDSEIDKLICLNCGEIGNLVTLNE